MPFFLTSSLPICFRIKGRFSFIKYCEQFECTWTGSYFHKVAAYFLKEGIVYKKTLQCGCYFWRALGPESSTEVKREHDVVSGPFWCVPPSREE